MVELKRVDDIDFFSPSVLAHLIYSSAPTLLSFLFSGKLAALDYISKASERDDGQYSATRHCLATQNSEIVGCITLWDNSLSQTFHSQTLRSLKDFLRPEQISHLVYTNGKIAEVFLAPLAHQLCVGHLAVQEEHKGCGIGKNMLAYAVTRAKQKGKTELVLDVDSANNDAVGFYYAQGFVLSKATSLAYTEQTFYRMLYKVL
jgi:ribosomal protein S18 acetylase RimI-like enzyme